MGLPGWWFAGPLFYMIQYRGEQWRDLAKQVRDDSQLNVTIIFRIPPGPLAPPGRSWPSLNMTALSYSNTTWKCWYSYPHCHVVLVHSVTLSQLYIIGVVLCFIRPFWFVFWLLSLSGLANMVLTWQGGNIKLTVCPTRWAERQDKVSKYWFPISPYFQPYDLKHKHLFSKEIWTNPPRYYD